MCIIKAIRFPKRSVLIAVLSAVIFSGTVSAALVINNPDFTSQNTTMDRFYQILTPTNSAHNLTNLTITSFLTTDGGLVTTNYSYGVTFYADNSGTRGAALTSEILYSSVTGLLSTAPTLATPPFRRFEVTFNLSSSPVSIGAGEAFWYKLSSTVPNQNIVVGLPTNNYGNGWGTGNWGSTNDSNLANPRTPGILLSAGAAAPIPEPGTWAAMAIFAGGAAYAGWRRRRQVTL